MEVRKALTAKTRLRHTAALDHGAHGASSTECARGGGEQGGSLREIETLIGSGAFCAPLGRMPSKWLMHTKFRAVHGVE